MRASLKNFFDDFDYFDDSTGQLSIFFGASLIVIITCLAFIVNVGLFVKAKINLQNAVDAAAWSGAAVQARQLSNIAYLNWEMRNVFKEWMFKYYVLGTNSNPKTYAPQVAGDVDFTISPGSLENTIDKRDKYNAPSVCIEISGSTTPICKIFNVPGLPRFNQTGLTPLDDAFAALSNTLIEKKAEDCSKRSELNYLTTLRWAYGIPSDSRLLLGAGSAGELFRKAPNLAANREGAWIKALELAFRIRNLEKIMNLIPEDAHGAVKLCQSGTDCVRVQALQQQGPLPLYERSVKAFWSGYRNLENNDGTSDLKHSFTLTELVPIAYDPSGGGTGSLSTIPIDPQKVSAKHYVDLHLHAINYVTLYTMFTSRTGEATIGSNAILTDSSCGQTKTALPVPAYPLGFVKNPEVLTYFAVKGEAKYVGLFNPFQGNGSVSLTAYAAAKPFGGKIGPMLFMSGSLRTKGGNSTQVKARDTRSFSYLSMLAKDTTISPPTNDYVQGSPLPMPGEALFWITNAEDVIGGVPELSVRYGIPNLIYANLALNSQSGSGDFLLILKPDPIKPSGQRAGLYERNQFNAFRENFVNRNANGNIENAILLARAPTAYDSMNYLIPTSREFATTHPPDSPEILNGVPRGPTQTVDAPLFAPLWSDGTSKGAYYQLADMDTAIKSYIFQTRESVLTYIRALNDVAGKIKTGMVATFTGQPTTADAGIRSDLYITAGNEIYNYDEPCSSIGGKFEYFFLGTVPRGSVPKCVGVVPLSTLIYKFWEEFASNNQQFSTFYWMSFTPHHVAGEPTLQQSGPNERMMTAYSPGAMYGADPQTGIFPHPFLGSSVNAKRNYYSTKLIPIRSVAGRTYPKEGIKPYVQGGGSALGSFTQYSEYDHSVNTEIQYTFKNPIPTGPVYSGNRPIFE